MSENYHNDDFQPCSKRHRLTAMNKEGERQQVFRCTEPTADAYFDIVSPSVCESCPLRREVTLKSMAKKEYDPPLVEQRREESRTRDLENREFNRVKWLPCVDRDLVEVPACCGQTATIKVCNSVDCFRMGSQVTPADCGQCLHRREQ